MIERFIGDVAHSIGAWAYLLVGGLAYLETAAFIGLLAPGETAVMLGGVLAGEGTISVYILCGLVWLAAFLGDTTSFFIGRKLGRGFLERHGSRLRITNERLEQVEGYFKRHGGKTILIGRFIGIVRALAPFMAGTSGMRYTRFMPYDLLSAGLWGTTFVLLGFFFWKSFGTVADIAGKSTLAFGILVGVIILAVVAVKRLRRKEERERLKAWARRQARRRTVRVMLFVLRPVWLIVRPVWRGFIQPVWRVVLPQLRFLGRRLTPGELGLEFTSLLAATAVGSYVFALYASVLHGDLGLTPADGIARDIVSSLRTETFTQVEKVVTGLGSPGVVSAAIVVTIVVLCWRRLFIEAGVLVSGSVLTYAAVQIAKEAVGRPRPPDELVAAAGSSFPSGHAAFSVAFLAIALIAWRVAPALAQRFLLVAAALVVGVAVGLSRVYLGVHYLSDVTSGWALAVAVFGITGVVGLIIGYLRENRSPPP